MSTPPTNPKPGREFIAAQRLRASAVQPKTRAPPVVGLALNGGGDRALLGAVGILRGLHQMHIAQDGKSVPALDGIDVMCANSGGYWATAAYCFSPYDSKTLLESQRSNDPKDVTSPDLDCLPKTSINAAAVRPVGWQFVCLVPFAVCGWLTRWGPLCFLKGVDIHNLWEWIVASVYLWPYGIRRGKYFTTDEAEAERLAHFKTHLSKEDFIWPREEVKAMPCACLSMVGPADGLREFTQQSVQMSKAVWTGQALDPPTTPEAARKAHQHISVVPYFATTAQVGTKYDPITMSFERRTYLPPQCCAVPPPLVVAPFQVKLIICLIDGTSIYINIYMYIYICMYMYSDKLC